MLGFPTLASTGFQPWQWNWPGTALGLLALGHLGEGEALQPATATVGGRRAVYGEAGDGPTVVFLPAWGLSFRPYQASLGRLIAAGYRVYAPGLPGFGGTANLPPGELSMAGYAAWVAAFLDEVDVTDPAFVIGHSFGAGVAVQLAHDRPERVGYLVLMDAVGTSWYTPAPLQQQLRSPRPLVSWISEAWKQILPFPEGLQTMQAATMDLMGIVLANGWAAFQAGQMARASDLSEQLAELRLRQLPLLCLANEDDLVVPDRCFQTLAAVMGQFGPTLERKPGWLLAGPGAFDAVTNRVATILRSQQWQPARRSPAQEVIELHSATDFPADLAHELVTTASPLWLLTDQPEALATDIALCHPPLATGEVRAATRLTAGSHRVRLTVVAADRPGLLADTAAVLAVEGYSVSWASACSWPALNLALHTLVFDPGEALNPNRWEELSVRLRTLGRKSRAKPAFQPIGPAQVTVNGTSASDTVVEVSAPDSVGLLWAICRWFADHDITIASAHACTNYGMADTAFIVHGSCDPNALAGYLSPPAGMLSPALSSEVSTTR